MAKIRSTLEIALEKAEMMCRQLPEDIERVVSKPSEITPFKNLAERAYEESFRLCKEGRFSDAVEKCKESLVYDPRNFEVLNNLGVFLTSLGRFEEAETTFKRAIDIAPNDPTINYSLGALYRDQGRVEDAIKIFRTVIEIDPNYGDAYGGLGDVYHFLLNDFDAAIDCYQKQIKLNPRKAIAFNNLGCIYDQKGDPEEAVKHYYKALEVDPDYMSAHANLVKYFSKQQDFKKAEVHLSHLDRLDPDSLKTKCSYMVYFKCKGDEFLAYAARHDFLVSAINEAEQNHRFVEYKNRKNKVFICVDDSVIRTNFVFKKGRDRQALIEEFASTQYLRGLFFRCKSVEAMDLSSLGDLKDKFDCALEIMGTNEFKQSLKCNYVGDIVFGDNCVYLILSRKDVPTLKKLLPSLDDVGKTEQLVETIDSLAVVHSGIFGVCDEEEKEYILSASHAGETVQIPLQRFDYMGELKMRAIFGRDKPRLGNNDKLDDFLESYASFVRRKLTLRDPPHSHTNFFENRTLTGPGEVLLHADLAHSNILEGGIFIDLRFKIGDPMLDLSQLLENPNTDSLDKDFLRECYFERIKVYAPFLMFGENKMTVVQSYRANTIHNAITWVGSKIVRGDIAGAQYFLRKALVEMEREGEDGLRESFIQYLFETPHRELKEVIQ